MSWLCQEIRVLSQPIAGAFDLYDHGVVKQPVKQGRGDDRIAKNVAPFSKSPVRCQNHCALLVAGIDQLEEQVAGAGTDGQVSDLIELCCARHKSTHVESAVMWSCSILTPALLGGLRIRHQVTPHNHWHHSR
jgi:hypothetical protein